jgi:hypothetical protein
MKFPARVKGAGNSRAFSSLAWQTQSAMAQGIVSVGERIPEAAFLRGESRFGHVPNAERWASVNLFPLGCLDRSKPSTQLWRGMRVC